MTAFDYDLFVIGGGSGGVRAGAAGGSDGKARRHRRGIPFRRNLRHPRLRAEEALRLRVAVSRTFRGFGRLRLDAWARATSTGRRWSPTRIRRSSASRACTARAWRRPAARSSKAAPCSSTDHTVELVATGKRVTADQILIAVGGRPNPHTSLPGHEFCISSNEAFHLKRNCPGPS